MATLIDSDSPSHPDLTETHQPTTMINDWEMRRLNMEMSANLSWIMKRIKIDQQREMDDLLVKAAAYLPMGYFSLNASKGYQKNLIRFAAEKIPANTGFVPHGGITADTLLRSGANAIINQTWRNGASLEDIHATSEHSRKVPLSPHERRLNESTERELVEKMISHMIAAYRALPEVVQQITLDSILVVQTP